MLTDMLEVTVRDDELAEIVDNLRAVGSDIADVEVKAAAGGLPKSLRATLSAFANTRGGVVILGLDESAGFTATSIPDPAKLSADLASLCATDMEPALRPLIGLHDFEGDQIVVAEIPQIDPASRPCFYRGAGVVQGSFVRVGDGDHRMSSYEVQLMLSGRGQPRWDEEPVPGTGVDDLASHLVEALVNRLRVRRPYGFADLDTISALRLLKVLVADERGQDVVSLGGLLALGRYPQARFPQLMLSFVHFPRPEGADVATGERFVDNVVVEGPVPVMVRDALIAIHRNMSRRSFVRGVGREDVWEYPGDAVREAVANALIHRDLSPDARGAQVQVAMYPDKLTVHSPGGLHGSVTVDQLGEEGVTSTRNAMLLRVLEDVPVPGTDRPVCENRGTGIRLMISSLKAAGMSPPEFTDRISRFTATFPNHTLLDADVVRWIDSLGQAGLSESQCVGLAVLREGGFLDNRSYRAHVGVDSRVATAELRDLVERGLASQVGTRRWARYELVGSRVASADGSRLRSDRRVVILSALTGTELLRTEISELTGLSATAVRYWLRVLRAEGAVEPTGNPKSPNVRYRRTVAEEPS